MKDTFVYLLLKYREDIEKAYVDSVWDSKGGAKEKGRQLMKDGFHVYIESHKIQSNGEKSQEEVIKQSSETEPYTEYDYHYSPCEEYGDYDPFRSNWF